MPSLIVMTVGFGLAGILSDLVAGSLWGLAAAVVFLGALRLAAIKTTPWEMGLVAVAMIAATALSSVFLASVPEAITPSLTLRLGGAWLVAGLGVGILVWRHRRPSSAVNVALIWAGAGVLVLPMAIGFEYLDLKSATVGAATFVMMSVVVALLGGAATLAAITGVRGIGIAATLLAISWFAGAQVGFSILRLVDNFQNIANFPDPWPPAFGWAVGEGEWWWLPSWDFGNPTLGSPLIETFQIGIIAAVIGVVVALPVSFLASKITAPGRISYLLDKGFMNVTRTIPDLFWAMFFVAGLGVGPLPGVFALFFFSLAIMSKLLSETVDSVDTGPLEAARATGGSHFPAVRMSVLPQVLPNYVAYALYIFELSIRASLVLGIVGGGGIGRVLEAQRKFFRFDRVFAVVIVIFVIVFLIEQVSVALRRRLV